MLTDYPNKKVTNMTTEGHTPASILKSHYEYCCNRYEGALKSICLLAIDIYHTETHPRHREIVFKLPEHEPDADKAIHANVKKVHGYFKANRTANLPFSFAHFIGRAIDQLYQRGCIAEIQSVMAGPKVYAGKIEEIQDQAKSLNKESFEALQSLLSLMNKGSDEISQADLDAAIKENKDAHRVLESVLATLIDKSAAKLRRVS